MTAKHLYHLKHFKVNSRWNRRQYKKRFELENPFQKERFAFQLKKNYPFITFFDLSKSNFGKMPTGVLILLIYKQLNSLEKRLHKDFRCNIEI